jgi:hypothetical protein
MLVMARGFLCFLLATGLYAQGGTVVYGTLTSSTTHAPIGGVQVMLERQGGSDYSAETDAAGAFRITGIAAGEYKFNFRTNDFLGPPANHPARKPLRIAASGDPIHTDIELVPVGRIRGRVLDSEGRPMPRIGIQMRRLHGGGGSMSGTDDDGRFTISGLGPGAYVLSAEPDNRSGSGKGPAPKQLAPPQEDGPTVWAPTFFPNVTEQSMAQPIVIRGGSDLAGFDIRVRAVPVRRVRGTVVNDDGTPLPKAHVQIGRDGTFFTTETAVTANDRGEFEFPAVRAGAWHLSGSARTLKGASSLTVGREEIEGIRLRLVAPFALTGFVDRADPRDAKGQRQVSTVQLLPTARLDDLATVATHEQDGSLRFPAVYPGRYEIRPTPPPSPGSYLESVRLGETDVTNKPVDLVDGSQLLRVTYKSDGGRVRGTVEKGEGSMIAVVPQDPALLHWLFIATSPCGANGSFEVAGLRPGAYYVFAFDRIVEDWALQDQSFLNTVMSRAERVVVKTGEATTVTPKLTSWPE